MKKLLTILVLIMLIISFFQVTSMYALYKEQIQGEYKTLMGAWKIKVNGTDVTTSGQVETFTISDINQLGHIESGYIQAGKIAPTRQTYFDIVIDPSNTDVSIVYTIDVDTKALSTTNTDIELVDAIEFLRAENYFEKVEEGNTIQTENEMIYKDGNTYKGVIPIGKITQGYENRVRIYFEWKNVTQTTIVDGEEVVTEINNELDTILGETQSAKISIPIQINLKQYTGEVIGNES